MTPKNNGFSLLGMPLLEHDTSLFILLTSLWEHWLLKHWPQEGG